MTNGVIITLIICGSLVAMCALDAIKNIVFKIIDGKRIKNIFKGDQD